MIRTVRTYSYDGKTWSPSLPTAYAMYVCCDITGYPHKVWYSDGKTYRLCPLRYGWHILIVQDGKYVDVLLLHGEGSSNTFTSVYQDYLPRKYNLQYMGSVTHTGVSWTEYVSASGKVFAIHYVSNDVGVFICCIKMVDYVPDNLDSTTGYSYDRRYVIAQCIRDLLTA